MRFSAIIVAALAVALQAHEILPGENDKIKIIKPDGTQSPIDYYVLTALKQLRDAGGGKLRLLPGDYFISSGWHPIDFQNAASIEIEGSGEATVFRTRPGDSPADAYMYFANDSDLSIKNINFSGMALDTSKWGNNDKWHGGLQFFSCRRVTITNCIFSGFYTGAITVQAHSSFVNIANNTFKRVSDRSVTGGDYGAVAIEGSSDVNVNNNLFYDLTHSMVSINAGKRVVVSANNVGFLDPSTGARSMGVFGVSGTEDCVISDNIFLNPANEGVVLDSHSGGTVARNIITGNRIQAMFSGVTLNLWDSKSGCDITTSSHNVIANNQISGIVSGTNPSQSRVSHGIFLNKVVGSMVTGNSIYHSENAINLQKCTQDNVISNNNIEDASVTAITSNGRSVVSGNIINNAGEGIRVGNTTSSTVNDNRFISIATSPFVIVDPAAQAMVTVWNNSTSEDRIIQSRLGVGVSAPTAKLDVDPGTVSQINPNLRLRGTTATTPSNSFGNSGDVLLYDNGVARKLYIKFNGIWRSITFN